MILQVFFCHTGLHVFQFLLTVSTYGTYLFFMKMEIQENNIQYLLI